MAKSSDDGVKVVLTESEEAHRRSRFPELSREEYRHMLDFCAKHNLNAWSRTVYPKFRDCPGAAGHRVVEFELTIEGIRTIAHRTGQYAGNEVTKFAEDGEGRLVSATAYAYRLLNGERFLYAHTVRWGERENPESDCWRTMPHTMLGKCAEAGVLRLAFPEQLGGIYVEGELNPERMKRTPRSTVQTHEDIERRGVEPTDETPTSAMQFELKLIHVYGLGSEAARKALVRSFEERYPHLLTGDPDVPPLRFWATVLYCLASEPEKYGVAAG
ncbi:MAG TPA: recombinase RecT [Tepidisphaeraceae bacterium]|jgi:phage recombination protein Bet|nr:recombinase RecT [Tepidisphaeraceae bacterium]